ncbi:MAG TPA: Xaa-Pro peptidase family protein [Puia sp.]|nr:Xaa-Pro peptidase family protein [Puia sp.]
MIRIDKLTALGRLKETDAFLITSGTSVKYFSGYFYQFETGASPFHLLPAALLIVPGKTSTLIIADNEAGAAMDIVRGVVCAPYKSYGYQEASDPARQFVRELQKVIRKHKLSRGRIGIEAGTLPFIAAMEFPEMEWADITSDIAKLRAVKDEDEIATIRAAARLCDIGQAAVIKHVRPGMSELELFGLVRGDMEAAAGTRFPLMADFVSGERTASAGGPPTNRIVREGELVLSDLTACLNGYWGDSCSTIAVGDPAPSRKRVFRRVKEALAIGIDATRPGARAMDIDALMRAHTGGYPHHSGHGAGVMYHEEPRIVPYNKMVLVPNMIIALEPAIYMKEYGIRLEHLLRVTESGCEVLTQFKHSFEQALIV